MIRKIIRIDKDACNGCGLCVDACHEGAIALVDGKATLMRDDYCDGLGDCLPVCPTGAISFEEREAAPYDEEAVLARMANNNQSQSYPSCPGTRSQALQQTQVSPAAHSEERESQLAQWPIQIKLVPLQAAFFNEADLLIAADCTAYAYASFHEKFMHNKVTLIGCPKLDEGDYAEKLAAIFSQNNITSITVARMEVPCCGGLENAVMRALENSGKEIPCNIVTISIDGAIL